MKRITVLVAALMGCALAFYSQGCAKISMTTTCPASSTGVGFALAGSTVGNQLLSMFGSAAAMGLMAPRAGAATPATTATMTYEYLAVFGADSGSLTCVSPPATTTVVTSPPASILH